MAVTLRDSSCRVGPGAEGPGALETWAASRRLYLDNLKVLLIAAIIAIHAVLGYASTVEAWTYTELREVTLAPATEVVLFVAGAPFGLFLMALLFLVAGLLTPPSLERKGTRRFVVDRLVRLGCPFSLYVLVVQPVLTYALEHPLGRAPRSFWEEYGGPERRLDTGPLWFVGVLLVFSLGYAAWRAAGVRWLRRRESPDGARQITARTLTVAAVVVAPFSFAVRLAYPYGSESGVSDLNFWEWPACIAVFGLGVAASRRGWAADVPARIARQCGAVTLAGAVAMAVLVVFVGSQGSVDEALGGAHAAALVFAAVDGVLTVFGSVWLLSVAQHRLDRPLPRGQRLSRSAYGAFMLQTAFLLAFAVALRPVGLPAEVKALLVAAGAIACSFGAAWLLITRVPGVSRIL